MTLLPLMLAGTLCQAAETVKVYNWSDYIAPDTMKNFQRDTGDIAIKVSCGLGFYQLVSQFNRALRVGNDRAHLLAWPTSNSHRPHEISLCSVFKRTPT